MYIWIPNMDMYLQRKTRKKCLCVSFSFSSHSSSHHGDKCWNLPRSPGPHSASGGGGRGGWVDGCLTTKFRSFMEAPLANVWQTLHHTKSFCITRQQKTTEGLTSIEDNIQTPNDFHREYCNFLHSWWAAGGKLARRFLTLSWFSWHDGLVLHFTA